MEVQLEGIGEILADAKQEKEKKPPLLVVPPSYDERLIGEQCDLRVAHLLPDHTGGGGCE